MKTVYLAQVAHRFGPNAFLPYSAGRIWAYAAVQPEVASKFRLAGLLWARDPISILIDRLRLDPPDVFGFSTYIWNEQYNLTLARAVKAVWPHCLIVFGGPQVPERTPDIRRYFNDHDQIDVLVHGEGEQAFVDVLLHDRDRWGQGISHCYAGAVQIGGKGARLEDPGRLPSPYVAGVFDSLLAEPGISWQALHETNRGCPYQCTFCDWGSSTFSKVTRFSIETVKAEIDWASRNRIEVLYNCDANFGMLEQDEAIADHLIEVNGRTGYPQKFRAAYAKKITDRVFRIARKLSDAGLSKGATISFQSLHQVTLDAVKRINPVQKTLRETLARYNEANVPTYTEMILGLPGETYQTFVDGIDALLEAGQHVGLAVYPCMSLRNSELSDPRYVELHGLRTVRVQQLLLHGTPVEGGVSEWYDLVIETATLSHEDWLRAWLFAIVVQALHGGGLTTGLAIKARKNGLRYAEFYHRVILSLLSSDTVGSRAYQSAKNAIRAALKGGDWQTVLPDYGSVQWPLEEAFLLQILREKREFYDSLRETLAPWVFDFEIDHQASVAPDPADWPDLETFAREVVWYGRKGRKPVKEVAA